MKINGMAEMVAGVLVAPGSIVAQQAREVKKEWYMTADEAVKMMGRVTMDEALHAANIVERSISARYSQGITWSVVFGIASAWNAGRIEGIRSERRKRRKAAVK